MSRNCASLYQISDKREIFVCQSIFAYKPSIYLYFNSTRYSRVSNEKISLSVFVLSLTRNRSIRIVVKSIQKKKYLSQIRIDLTLLEICKMYYLRANRRDARRFKKHKIYLWGFARVQAERCRTRNYL